MFPNMVRSNGRDENNPVFKFVLVGRRKQLGRRKCLNGSETILPESGGAGHMGTQEKARLIPVPLAVSRMGAGTATARGT
jgi:hypothetical protein